MQLLLGAGFGCCGRGGGSGRSTLRTRVRYAKNRTPRKASNDTGKCQRPLLWPRGGRGVLIGGCEVAKAL